MKAQKSFLSLPFRVLLVCLVLLIPAVSCSKDDDSGDGNGGQSGGTTLTTYQKLRKTADSSLTIDNIASTETLTVLTLSDNSTIELLKKAQCNRH